AIHQQQREEWKSALENFKKSKLIYEQLGKIVGADVQNMCRDKTEEISTSIRYCEHRSRLDQSDDKTVEDSKGIEDIQSKLDIVLADEMKKQAENTKDVVWKGKRIPVRNDKVQLALLNAQEVTFSLDKEVEHDAKISLYDKLFVYYNDALDIVKSDMTEASGGRRTKGPKPKLEMNNEQLSSLKSYLQSLKLSKTIDRNLLLVDQQEQRLATSDAQEGSRGKRSTPAELIRLYEALMQNLKEMNDLQSEDEESVKLNQASILSYKTYRCYYLALTYVAVGKWNEAAALLDRADDQIRQARAHHKACKEPNEELLGKLDTLQGKIRGSRSEVLARRVLDKKVGENSKSVIFKEGKVQIASFPPDFEPVAVKPVLFDLALAGINFPSLEGRIQTKKAGWLGGWFKG
ncbi:putative signal recognition particle protein, partial [Planoprotostelium fungivorum]